MTALNDSSAKLADLTFIYGGLFWQTSGHCTSGNRIILAWKGLSSVFHRLTEHVLLLYTTHRQKELKAKWTLANRYFWIEEYWVWVFFSTFYVVVFDKLKWKIIFYMCRKRVKFKLSSRLLWACFMALIMA